MLGPPNELSSVFGYLIKNQYTLEHLKSISVKWQVVALKQVEEG